MRERTIFALVTMLVLFWAQGAQLASAGTIADMFTEGKAHADFRPDSAGFRVGCFHNQGIFSKTENGSQIVLM